LPRAPAQYGPRDSSLEREHPRPIIHSSGPESPTFPYLPRFYTSIQVLILKHRKYQNPRNCSRFSDSSRRQSHLATADDGFPGTAAARSFGGGRRAGGARPCDNCGSAAAAKVFCAADAAFLCLACDAGVHGANALASRHERSWVCEACERAPAAFACRADAAALCAACDADVHSANPLAGRHVRIPLEPFRDAAAAAEGPFGTGSVPDFPAAPAVGDRCCGAWGGREEEEDEEEEARSWLLPNATKIAKGAGAEAGDAFWSEVNPFLKFECGGSTAIRRIDGECLVPVRYPHQSGECFDVDFSTSGDLSPSSQSVSTSVDFGVVPDESPAPPETPCSSGRAAHQLSGPDREARVLRYREKRRSRRFEKTIRYASRKAYAEVRPRIKGRFAKRDRVLETEDESAAAAAAAAAGVYGIAADAEHGVVPTFSHVPMN
ncbi:zinc finger protein CONSTANS-LIKE 5-like, partial [Eucalyptus grandis]|uniref:zinc finger protein CONSTANS-LIKE 5-like n=1 Tax=Eucalyptus grandis TaxID=71139 RepID=UPI00192E9BC9